MSLSAVAVQNSGGAEAPKIARGGVNACERLKHYTRMALYVLL
jgi:hypothetical protein